MKEPKKWIAYFLVVYIVCSLIFISHNFSERAKQIPKEITGLGSTGTVGIGILSFCRFSLDQNYNLISLCADTKNSSIKKVLEPVSGKYSFVLRWNVTRQEFDVFSPEAASNPFDSFNLNESYFIFMNEGSELNIYGAAVNDTTIGLANEFNSPSYPYLVTANASRYLQQLLSSVMFALKWNSTRQEFDVFSPEAVSSPFQTIGKGEGQFIYMSSPGMLSYNRTAIES